MLAQEPVPASSLLGEVTHAMNASSNDAEAKRQTAVWHGSDSDDELAARMLATTRVRAGYFTASGRSPSAELAWVDTDRGRFSSRYVTDPAGRRSTAHTPVGRDEPVSQLAGLLRDAQ